jgi:hypothetical protein
MMPFESGSGEPFTRTRLALQDFGTCRYGKIGQNIIDALIRDESYSIDVDLKTSLKLTQRE